MKKQVLLLILIVALAGFLRFWHLGTNPPSLTWDEVAWGYNGYSLGLDGKDEFGRFLPLNYLESFGDFKPPLYAYLTVIPVWLFGLTEFATRFASAFFGTLTIFVTYFLVKNMFREERHADTIALLSSFFFAISPWHINLSRAAFEANVATFLLVTGTYFFVKAMRSTKKYLLPSALCFILSVYTFNTARVFAPLFLVFLAIGFRKELLMHKKEVVVASIFGFVALLPILPFLFSPQAGLRYKEVNIFSDISVIERVNQEIANDNNALWSKIIHNRRFTYAFEFAHHYFDNLNPLFLFIKGDGNPKFSTQDVGQLYLFDVPFLIIGGFLLFRNRKGFWWILPGWLLLGILPAATARETPHALRIETVMPTFQVITAYGLVHFIDLIHWSSPFLKKSLVIFVFGILLIQSAYYLHGYYTHYPLEFSGEWQYGYKESISYVKSVEKNYSDIYITQELGRPYVYYLFYLNIQPSEFRNDSIVTRDVFGFVSVNKVGKYHFLKSFDKIPKKVNQLFITAGNAPQGSKILKEFRLLNNRTILTAYTY